MDADKKAKTAKINMIIRSRIGVSIAVRSRFFNEYESDSVHDLKVFKRTDARRILVLNIFIKLVEIKGRMKHPALEQL
ncbi:MAG: hypothetical protein L3J69_12450 [Desulfobacula sp.]|nr:hypothetical protein [Desulfobacula sp.]